MVGIYQGETGPGSSKYGYTVLVSLNHQKQQQEWPNHTPDVRIIYNGPEGQFTAKLQ